MQGRQETLMFAVHKLLVTVRCDEKYGDNLVRRGAVGRDLLLTHLKDLALVLRLEAAVRLGWCLSRRPAGIHSIRKSYFTQHPCCIRNVRRVRVSEMRRCGNPRMSQIWLISTVNYCVFKRNSPAGHYHFQGTGTRVQLRVLRSVTKYDSCHG